MKEYHSEQWAMTTWSERAWKFIGKQQPKWIPQQTDIDAGLSYWSDVCENIIKK